jgi:hypothetical protein
MVRRNYITHCVIFIIVYHNIPSSTLLEKPILIIIVKNKCDLAATRMILH